MYEHIFLCYSVRLLYSIFIAVFVVYTDEGAAEGQDLAKGDEHAVVYLRQRRSDETRCE